MSRATTASPSRAAYRISNTTDRTAAVTGTPSTTTTSSGCRNSWLTAIPRWRDRWRLATTVTSRWATPPSVPSNQGQPSHWRAAHPVTASSSLSRAAASTIRCCAVTSTRDGTTSPWLVVRHRGPRDCPRVGPTVPRGSTRTGATSSERRSWNGGGMNTSRTCPPAGRRTGFPQAEVEAPPPDPGVVQWQTVVQTPQGQPFLTGLPPRGRYSVLPSTGTLCHCLPVLSNTEYQ